MPERSFKEWYKLAFRLLVTDEWDKVAEVVENTDVTYRWLKEQITAALEGVMNENFRERIHGSALNLRDRIFSLKIVTPDDDCYNGISFWLKSEVEGYILRDGDEKLAHRILSCKFAMLCAAMVHYDEPKNVALYFRAHLQQLSYIEDVSEAPEGKENPDLLADVKRINEAARDYIMSLGVELEDWPEFNIKPEALPASTPPYQPPEIWCFGDYGMRDGQISYPEKVLVDKEGNFLVLEENVIGMGGIVTIQRVQLFSAKGEVLKCLLKRGEGKVNGMHDICLDKEGNVVVIDTDDKDNGRIQVFDYDGNLKLKISPETPDECLPPRFSSVAVDPVEGLIVAGDINKVCVHVFSPDGKPQCQIGKSGKEEGEFQSISTVCCDDSAKIYVMDPSAKRVQVFDTSGNYLSLFSSPIVPRYVVFDPKRDEVYGSDYWNHKVQVYNQDGSLLREHGKSRGTSLKECWFPYGLALMADGRIAIAERENHRVKVLKI